MKTSTKIITSVSAVILVALAVFLYVRFWFPYSEGTDTGELNYFQYKGYVFKTYEGKIIQSGLKRFAADAGGVQSNEFNFSVVDPAIADSLMHCTGRTVEVHYRRYLGTLPWRGETTFVVDSIWSVK